MVVRRVAGVEKELLTGSIRQGTIKLHQTKKGKKMKSPKSIFSTEVERWECGDGPKWKIATRNRLGQFNGCTNFAGTRHDDATIAARVSRGLNPVTTPSFSDGVTP